MLVLSAFDTVCHRITLHWSNKSLLLSNALSHDYQLHFHAVTNFESFVPKTETITTTQTAQEKTLSF